MIHFKGVLIGICTVLLASLVVSIAWMVWAGRGAQDGEITVSFSLMGLAHHLGQSPGLWIFVVLLFAAGFVPYLVFSKGRRDRAR